MDWISILGGSGVTLGIIVVGYFVKDAVFKKGSEIEDRNMWVRIKELLSWKEKQESNNVYQQKLIDIQSKDIESLRLRVARSEEDIKEFTKEQRRTNELTVKKLEENTVALTHVGSTLDALKPVLEANVNFMAKVAAEAQKTG